MQATASDDWMVMYKELERIVKKW